MLDTSPWCEPPQGPFAVGLYRTLEHRPITPSPCYRICTNNQLLEQHPTTVVCLIGKPDIRLNRLDIFSVGSDPWAILLHCGHLAARRGVHTDVLVLGTACTPNYCMFICLPGGCTFERKRIVCIRIGCSRCIRISTSRGHVRVVTHQMDVSGIPMCSAVAVRMQKSALPSTKHIQTNIENRRMSHDRI